MMAMGNDRPHSFRDALQVARKILSRDASLVRKNLIDAEAERIVSAAYRAVSGKSLSRLDLFSKMQDAFPPMAGQKVLEWANRRAEGALLQHVIGYQYFLSHDYEVGPAVLIPRPETELLVMTAIQEMKKVHADRPVRSPALGLEIGVGSGAISIELLCAFPGLRMVGSELVPEAREIAFRNSEKILNTPDQRARFEILAVSDPSHVLEPFEPALGAELADFLISNPPYLSAREEVDEEVALNEPHAALFAPPEDPLFFYRKIAEKAATLLTGDSWVFLEIPHERAGRILELFERLGWVARLVQDFNQRPRVLIAQAKPKAERPTHG